MLFLSYSRDDERIALRLANDLRGAGIPLWMDQLDIRAGQQWDIEVEAGLRGSAGMLVLLSPASVASQSVMDEVSFALDERKNIVPVVARPCAVPFRLRRLQHIDLSDGYEAGLDRLIRELRLLNPPGPDIPPVPPPPHQPPTPTPRLRSALQFGLAGAAFTAIACYMIFLRDPRFSGPFQPPDGSRASWILRYSAVGGLLWSVVGAFVSGNPKARQWALIVGAGVMIAWVPLFGNYQDVLATGVTIGGPMAAIATALVYRTIRRRSAT